MVVPQDVLGYWLDEVGPEKWYAQDDALDAAITDRFGAAWRSASEGAFSLWLTHAGGVLAYCVLTDQFPRNMFRDDPRAFSTDHVALAAAKMAIAKGWDLRIDAPARQFFYLPLMHSENLCDQERCVRLILERMPEAHSNLLHARAHRDVIRRFGRFPHRNAALSRSSTSGERAFEQAGGYGEIVRGLEARLAG